MAIERPNQVRATDITYIPMARGFVYLTAIVDLYSRRLLSHRVSITMDAGFCVEPLEESMVEHGRREIFDTDQSSQFTSAAFTGVLSDNAIAISMGSRHAWTRQLFVERLWRSAKCEDAYLRAYASVAGARASLDRSRPFTYLLRSGPESCPRQRQP